MQTKIAALDHVEDTPGSANNNVDTLSETCRIVADGRATNAGHALSPHVVTEGKHDLLDLQTGLSARFKSDSE